APYDGPTSKTEKVEVAVVDGQPDRSLLRDLEIEFVPLCEVVRKVDADLDDGFKKKVDLDVSISARDGPSNENLDVGGRNIGFSDYSCRFFGGGFGSASCGEFDNVRYYPPYYSKTREVEYWIGRRLNCRSKPTTQLDADYGIDLAAEDNMDRAGSAGYSQTRSEFCGSDSNVLNGSGGRGLSRSSDLHWTTVSETTSVSYVKRISIQRRRPVARPKSPVFLRSEPSAKYSAAVSKYDSPQGWADRGVSGLSRIAASRVYGFDERLEFPRNRLSEGGDVLHVQSTDVPPKSTRTTQVSHSQELPELSEAVRHQQYFERNHDPNYMAFRNEQHSTKTTARNRDDVLVTEHLRYKNSNLEEIPLVSLLNDLPMIEEGATEYSYATVQPIHTQDLSPGVHARPSRSAPLRRARQRIRNLCTML
uniref:DUF4005 domain-containing protein n=1 Tax=Syphacia muris TaxID=451379 RepID=A0A0N5AMJ7_9BILA